MKKMAIYTGSFDPITKGHLDIINRASKVFDEVIVTVLVNPDKKGLFNVEERVELIRRVTRNFENVKAESFYGLLVDYMEEKNANIIIKGLRTTSDFEYELQMAQFNKKLNPAIETMFFMTSAEYSYISSSSIKQIAMFNGPISDFVPDEIVQDVMLKFDEK